MSLFSDHGSYCTGKKQNFGQLGYFVLISLLNFFPGYDSIHLSYNQPISTCAKFFIFWGSPHFFHNRNWWCVLNFIWSLLPELRFCIWQCGQPWRWRWSVGFNGMTHESSGRCLASLTNTFHTSLGCPGLGCLNNRCLLTILEAGNLRRMPVWPGSDEGSFPDLQAATFLLCRYMVERDHLSHVSFQKGTSCIHESSILMT